VTPARLLTAAVLLLVAAPASASTFSLQARTLDGSGNNLLHPDWGRAGTEYVRVAPPRYTDGIAAVEDGPSARRISNRIFNDGGQNLFSENGTTEWGWVWGQFLDHDFGLEDQQPRRIAPIPFDPRDPLEGFRNDLLQIDFWRTPAAPRTGLTTPRQHRNNLSSYIDASNVYGVTASRLRWLRSGPKLLLTPSGYLPRATARGDAASAPPMELDGPLAGSPAKAVIAGDVRANENIALTAVQTLFAREHNRLVARLPSSLPAELRFQIARRIVGAEEQYVTYNEFLPAMGVRLAPYRGYRPGVDAALSNEFAVVGYRAHSMVNGSLDETQPAGTWAGSTLDSLAAGGVSVRPHDGLVSLSVPLGVAFGNPDLLQRVGLEPVLAGLGAEREYRNDEQIDNSLRSILFAVPKPGTLDPSACQGPTTINPACFNRVDDLGAIDLQRSRDHGIPSYNELRAAYGLAPKTTFEQVTGEPASPDLGAKIDDPSILDFVSLLDAQGDPVLPGSREAVVGIRRTTLASRLRALYGDVGHMDALVGMLAEQHLPGAEFGELQLAMWKRQFTALRDGDRFFYLNDPALAEIKRRFGITYKHSLSELLRLDAGVPSQGNVFTIAAP
jgi:hypothetical protein